MGGVKISLVNIHFRNSVHISIEGGAMSAGGSGTRKSARGRAHSGTLARVRERKGTQIGFCVAKLRPLLERKLVMKFNYLPIMPMATAFTACCFFNGCARETPKEVVYQPIQPAPRAPETQIVGPGINPPLNYQWYLTKSNLPTAEFTVTAGGTPALHYQWHINTGSDEGRQSTVQAIRATNGPLYYQWFKNTNSP
jgi:hypothetical protein